MTEICTKILSKITPTSINQILLITLQNCELRVNNQFLPSDAVGYITAQGRDSENDPGGFVFYGGHVSGNGKIFLGRAWGSYSRVIFQKLEFDINVMPQGWDAWEKPT